MVLTFKVGPGGNDTFTSIDSNPFDVYIVPDPPRNLRVHSYGDLGFRVEFEPAPVLRAHTIVQSFFSKLLHSYRVNLENPKINLGEVFLDSIFIYFTS